MNKQEIIRNIDLQTYAYPDEPPEGNYGPTIAYKKGFNSCAEWAINLIEQLDEQPKVTVPKFAADWFEKNKDDLTFAIYEAVAHSIKEAGYKHYSDEFTGWFAHSDNNSIETLIRMKDGYKVEEVK